MVMSLPSFVTRLSKVVAAELFIDGLAILCFNQEDEDDKFWEVTYIRLSRHALALEIERVDADGNPTEHQPFPDPIPIPEPLRRFDISLTTGSNDQFDTFPDGGPKSDADDFDRDDPDNDPHDLNWMIDLNGDEPGHGNVVRIKPAPVTFGCFHHSLIYTSHPSEYPVRLAPKGHGPQGARVLGRTNEEMCGVLLADEAGEIRFDGLDIDPLPFDDAQSYRIKVVNEDTESAPHSGNFAKGDFDLFYKVIQVDGEEKELWAVPKKFGIVAPDGDCNPSFISLDTLQS
jgi:hypothetical protein